MLLTLVAALVLGMGMPTAAMSAPTEEEETPKEPIVVGEESPYGVYLNGIPVTEDNKEDIFGDVIYEDKEEKPLAHETPRAVYDDKSRELRLSGNIVLDTFTTLGGIEYAILTTVSENVRVTIEEGSQITFYGGVRVHCGNFRAERATLIFDAPEEGFHCGHSEAFIRVAAGDIVFAGSRIECRSTKMLSVIADEIAEDRLPTGVGFAADDITLDSGARLVLSAARSYAPLHAVMWATEGITIASNSAVDCTGVPNEEYLADAFFRAEQQVRISDANVNIKGVDCAFALPDASLTIRDHSEVLVTALRGMVVGGAFSVEGRSYVELFTSDGGIAVVGDDASFRADSDTRFYMVRNSWGDTLRAGESAFALREQVWHTYPQAAFYGFDSPVSFKNSSFTASGYTYGILCRSNGDKLTFTGRYDIVARLAFLSQSEKKEHVNFGTEIKGDAALETIASFYGYITALVPHEGDLAVKEGVIGMNLDAAADIFTGYIGECHIQVKVFPVVAIIAPCVLLMLVTIVIIVLNKTGHVFIDHRKKNTSDDTEPSASDAAEETVSEEGDTNA